ncbi:MAG: alcohol dehydrogenase [Candidatus Omnitrophota bacterium]|nr:MAG: alcohol dehydrogenase [Candidatus Omnitrophota bacterium]
MRAAVYYSNKDIRIEERPKPKIGPEELLVRVEACGICGSDVMEWYRIDRVPLVLGHEISGIIEEAGGGIKEYKKGDRIACAHHVPCGNCHYCLSGHDSVCDTLRKTNVDPGGFAEYIRLPEINVKKGVFPLPDNVAFEEATFIEPVACVLRGQRLAEGVKGKSVLVLGSGIAGLLHIHLARIHGASLVVATDINQYRINAAKKFGAHAAFNAREYSPEFLRELNQGRLTDLVIVTSAAEQAIKQALESVERGGTILFFAPTDKNKKIPLIFNNLFWKQEITLTSSYAASPQEYQQALDLIASNKLNISEMITHKFALKNITKGFQLVAEAKDSIKVIIEPQK